MNPNFVYIEIFVIHALHRPYTLRLISFSSYDPRTYRSFVYVFL